MQLGIIGLGKMGKGLAMNMIDQGHQVIAYNRSPEPLAEVAKYGATPADSIKDLTDKLTSPKIIWLMLPSGDVTEDHIFGPEGILQYMKAGDILIEGANSHFKDSKRRAAKLQEQGIHFVDAGVSGGPSGARNGACNMVGGEKEIVDQLAPLFESISVPNGWGYFGSAGAGHFVKMVHNGIEYGMMQAIGEGFEVLKKSEFDLDLEKVTQVYNHGSVIESRLIGWLQSGYQEYGQDLTPISGKISHSGEGQWTVETAKEMNISVPVIEKSYQFRLDSQSNPSYTGQVVSTLRNQFGGHQVKKHET